MDRTLLQTKDIMDQGHPASPWILFVGEGMLVAVDTWEVHDGVLEVWAKHVSVHVLPVQSSWKLIRRELAELAPAREVVKAGKKDLLTLADELGRELPPDDRMDWRVGQ